jgi:hypothetical protein
MKQLTREILSDLSVSVNQFGTYSLKYMETLDIESKLRSLPTEDAAEVLLEVADSSADGRELASDLACLMADYDDFLDFPGIDELCQG